MDSNRFNSKLLAHVIVGILLLLQPLIILSPNSEGEGFGDYPWPFEGDWIIENDTHVSNETIILNGGIIITKNGSLTLENVTLLINAGSNTTKGIYVNFFGTLRIYDSNVSALNGTYTFIVFGNMSVERSKISHMRWGIVLYSSNVLIANSTIFDDLNYAIVCYGSPTIYNNTIFSYYAGIMSILGSPFVYNNTITSNGWGVNCLFGGSATLIGNYIYNNTLDGVYAESHSHLEIHDNIIVSNKGSGVQGRGAIINATNNLIYDNARWGIYSVGGLIAQTNNTFEKNGKGNSNGSVLQEWSLFIDVFDAKNVSLEDVHITIFDNYGDILWSGDTIGNFRTVIVREYEIKNNGSEVFHTPFKIRATKGAAINYTTVDVRNNTALKIVLDYKPKGEGKDSTLPLWGVVIIWGILLIDAIMIIVGLIVIRRRKRRSYI